MAGVLHLCRLLKAEEINQMLKQVQHDKMVRFWSFRHPELISGSHSWIWNLYLKPCPVGGVLC